MDAGNLTRDLVAPLLATDDPVLMRSIIEILGKHPDWADALRDTLATWLALENPTDEQLGIARGAVSALLARSEVQQLAAGALADAGTGKAMRLALLEAIAAAEFDERTTVWNDALRANLASSDSDVLRQTIVTATALDPRPLAEPLMAIGHDTARTTDVRIAALRAASKSSGPLRLAGFDFLAAQLTRQDALRDRLAAAEALGGFELTTSQLNATARFVEQANPLEIAWLLRAFEGDTNSQTGRTLVASLEKSPALESVSPQRLRETLHAYPDDVRAAAAELLERAAPDDSQRVAQIEALREAAEHGDAARGEEVFFSQRAACSACHRVAGRGESIGPELSKIGEIRGPRDLVEALLFPSASLARGYESFNVATSEGQVYSGLLSRETASAIYLRTTERAEIRVDRDQIDELAPNATSIMPQGLDKTLSAAELRDLVAFLQSLE
jgi:putative heme-binding domain-containing protein